MRREYRKQVLGVLMNHVDPSMSDVRLELCHNGLCPEKKCPFVGDDVDDSCGHIILTNILTNKVKHVLMGD